MTPTRSFLSCTECGTICAFVDLTGPAPTNFLPICFACAAEADFVRGSFRVGEEHRFELGGDNPLTLSNRYSAAVQHRLHDIRNYYNALRDARRIREGRKPDD